VGGATPAANAFTDKGPGLDFSSSAACLSDDEETERHVRIDVREEVAVCGGKVSSSTPVSFAMTEGNFDGGEVMVSYGIGEDGRCILLDDCGPRAWTWA
jgi:hypothetical protein